MRASPVSLSENWKRGTGVLRSHTKDVRGLPFDIGRAHVDNISQLELRAGRRGGDAMLPSAGFGDDPGLVHPARQQDLAYHIVDFVRAGMVQSFAQPKCAVSPRAW